MGLTNNSEIAEKNKSALDIEKLFDEIVDYFTRVEKITINLVNRGLKDKAILNQMVENYLKEKHVPDDIIKDMIRMFENYVFGYHILEPLIDDETISDIKITKFDCVRIKRFGKRMTSDVKFKDDADLNRFIEHVAIKNRINISDINAIQNFTDKQSNEKFILRLNISSPYVNSVPNSYLHIRKISKNKRGMDYLIDAAMMDQKTAEYLIHQAKTARGMLFTGKGASGKTTLMNELLEHIPEENSGLTIQENEELFSYHHPDIMFQHTVENRGEGKICYTLQDLARNGLLLDLDYYIIGEIKGGEALYFLNAAYTGHLGLATVHGQDGEAALYKLADYVKYEADYSQEEIKKMLGCISTVCYMKDFKLHTITEVKVDPKGGMTTRNVYEREVKNDNSD